MNIDDATGKIAPTPFELALSSAKSLSNWPAVVAELKARREAWIMDTRTPAFYQNHSELVQLMARVAELDHWIELFE